MGSIKVIFLWLWFNHFFLRFFFDHRLSKSYDRFCVVFFPAEYYERNYCSSKTYPCNGLTNHLQVEYIAHKTHHIGKWNLIEVSLSYLGYFAISFEKNTFYTEILTLFTQEPPLPTKQLFIPKFQCRKYLTGSLKKG